MAVSDHHIHPQEIPAQRPGRLRQARPRPQRFHGRSRQETQRAGQALPPGSFLRPREATPSRTRNRRDQRRPRRHRTPRSGLRNALSLPQPAQVSKDSRTPTAEMLKAPEGSVLTRRRSRRAEVLGDQFAAHYKAMLERRYGGAALKRDDGLALYRVGRPVIVWLDGHEVVDPERILLPFLVFDEDLITWFHLVEFVEDVGHSGPRKAEGVPRDERVRARYPGQAAAAHAEYALPVELGLPRSCRHGHVFQAKPRHRDFHGRRCVLSA